MQLNISFIKKVWPKPKTKVEIKESRQWCIGKVEELWQIDNDERAILVFINYVN